MNKRLVLSIMLSTLLSPLFAAKYNIDELKELAQKHQKDGKSDKVETMLEPPTSRFVDSSRKELSAEDKRHILVHMKLANRNFSKKNYEKAIEEINSVLNRDSAHSGAHFMRAVIAGRKKDYEQAWYHISAAKEKDSGNKKIDDFLTKLRTVSTEPKPATWISGIYNGLETNACDRYFDLMENLMNNECSQNITAIYSDVIKQEDSKPTVLITFKARSEFDSEKIISLIKSNNSFTADKNSNNELSGKISFDGLKLENANAKAVSNINDFINDLTEEMPEIAISNTEEGEPANGVQEITYDISTREFSTLNKFVRTISPYATQYNLLTLELAWVPGTQNTMWKARIKISYKR